MVDSVEDIKKKFAAKVRLPHAPLLQGLKSFQPELSVICDTELSVAQSSRHPLHSTGNGGVFGGFVASGVPALLHPTGTSPKGGGSPCCRMAARPSTSALFG